MLGFAPQRRMRAATPFRPVTLLALVCALGSLALAFTAVSASAAPGDLDTSFGSGGVRTDNLAPGLDDAGHAVAVQPDGKFIVAGAASPTSGWGAFSLMRFTAAGALDTSFGGGDGIVVQATGVDGGGTSVALQPDGKIIVGGTYWSRTGQAMEMYSFMRFNADGTLDTSFGGDGETQISLGSWGDYMQAVAVQPDGKIVGTGISTTGSAGVPGYSTARMGTVRLLADGSPDPLFGTNGTVITSIAGNYNKSRALAIQTDGKIVIGGDLNNPDDGFDDFAIVRYTTSGGLDSTFSGDGMQIVKFNALHDAIHAITLQPDGKIVAGGFANNETQFAIARLSTAGALDTSFSGDGIYQHAITGGGATGGINALDIQQNGDIVAGGFATTASGFGFALARYQSGGTLDTSFSSDGMQTTDVGGSGANGTGWNCDQTAPECPGIHGMGIMNDGKIVATGARSNGTTNDTYTARYAGDTTSLPTVSISAPANSSTVGSSITPTFTTATPGGVSLAQTTCQIDANAPYACTSGGVAQTGLAPGSHTLVVRVTDRVGISGSATSTFTTAALPTVAISSPTEGAVVAATGASATFSTSSTISHTVTCQIDTGAIITSCTSSRPLGTLAAGPHTFTVNATNATGTTTLVRNFSVTDNVAPSVPTSISATGITTTGATINWLPSTDNVAVTGYDVYRGGTLVGSTTGAVNYAMTGLTCGTSYAITVRARDAANNASAQSSAFTLNTANCSAPSVAITSPTAGVELPSTTALNNVTVNFTLSGTEPTSTTCKLDNLAAVTCGSSTSHTFTNVGQGPHTIVVTGNHTTWGNGSASVTFSIQDSIDPSIPNKSAFTLTNLTRTSATLGWPAQTDNVGVVRYYVYNSNTSQAIGEKLVTDPQPLQLDISGLTCGTSTWVRVVAIDAADHWGISDAYEIRTLDCPAAPVVAITNPANNTTIGGNSTSLTFTATQEPTSITCQLDAETPVACVSPRAYSSLTPGAHTIIVTATNALGSGAATVNFVVPDNEIPTAPGQPAISAITATTATATWAPSIDNVGVTAYDVYLNGTLKGSTTGAATLALTALTCNTTYSVTVRAKDGSGNTSPVSTSTSFSTLACPGPTVAITSPTAGQELAGSTTSVAVTFTVANGPATSTTCKLDGGAAVACVSGQSFAISSQGPHTIQVSVTNANGTNQSVVAFSVADTIDPAIPNKATFTTTNRTLTSATLNWPSISDNVGVVRYYVYNSDTSLPIGETFATDPNPLQLNITGLTCGTSTWIRLAAIDAADHWGISDAYEVTTLPCPTAPVVTITAPINGSTLAGYSTSVVFTATQNPTTLTCQLDGGAATACTSPQAYAGLTPGAHSVTVAATNELGADGKTVNFTVPDITAPTAPGTPETSAISAAGATLTWTGSTDNVGVTAYDVYVGGTLRGTTAANTLAVTGLNCNTTYSAYIRARDAASNGTNSATASFQTGVCPGPSVTITSPAAGLELPGTTTTIAPTFNVINGPADTTTCKLDDAAAVPCISGQSFAIGSQGPHTFQVTVTNVNGTNQAVVNFSVADTIDPATPDKSTFTTTNRTLTSATLNWPAGSDNVGVVRYFIYNSDTSLPIGEKLATDPQPTQLNITGLTCGTSTWIRLAAIDAADHWGISDAYEVTTLPCPTAPVVAISAPSNGSTLAGYSTSVAFTATQDPSSITCKLDAEAAEACVSPQVYSALAPGAHSVTVTATNVQGTGSAVVNFTVPDITAPTAPGVPSAGAITANGATLSWVGSTDNVGVTAYDVYAGGTLRGTTAATTFALTGLTCNTTYPIYIRAKDAAGNATNGAAGSFQTSVCPGPTVTITSPGAAEVFPGSTTSVSVTFTVANGPASSTTCKLDNAAPVACVSGQSFAIAAQGPHTLQVTVTNVNGTNSQVVNFNVTDTIDPATPDKALFTTTNRTLTSATLTWPAITDNVGVVRYFVFNSDTSVPIGETLVTDPQPLQLNITGLTCGTSTWIRLAAIDAAEHWGISDAYEVTTLPCPTAPVVAISAPVNGSTLAGYSTSVAFTATQDPTSVTCKLDAAAAEACTSPKAYSALAPGAHTVTVTATNSIGATSQVVNFTVPDITAPTTPGTPSISAITATTATANWVASTDNVEVTAYDVYVGGTLKGSTTGAATFALTGLTCGTSQSVTVRAKDAAGNVSSTSTAATFSTTTCPGPVPTIAAPTAGVELPGTTTSVPVTFSVASSGESVTTTCQLDAAAAVPCSSGYTFAPVAQGPHTIAVTASSSFGSNTATVAFSVADTVDPATPDKALFTTTNRTLTSATLNWPAITDNVGVARYYVFNSDTTLAIGEKLATDPQPLQLDITGLSCGTSTWVRLAAIDAANHWGISDAYEVTTLPCPTAPVVTITSPANNSTLAGYSTSVAFTATQDPTSITCKLDAAAAEACTSPKAYSALTPGAHTVSVAATNPQGTTTAVVNFTVPDVTAPSIPGTPVISLVTPTTATATWAASSDNVAVTGYDVYVGATLKGSTIGATTLALSGLTCGAAQSVTVRAKDAAGNVSSASPAANFSTTACPGPVPTITSPAAAAVLPGETTSVPVNFTLATSGESVTTTCQLDGAAAVPCVSGHTFNAVGQGPHTITVSSSSIYGTNAATVAFSILDTVDPSTPNKATFSITGVTRTGATVSWPAQTDNVGVERYLVLDIGWNVLANKLATDPNPLSHTLTGLTCGTTSWYRIVAVDAAAHWGTSDLFDVTTSPCLTNPVVTISSPANGASIVGGSTSVAFTATQEGGSFTCKLDDAPAEACSSPKAYSGLGEGPHTVVVTATNETGSGSATVTFTVPDTVAPTAPTDLATTAITGTTATLSWTAATDNVAVSGYDVYLGGTLKGSTAGPATTLALTGLTCGTSYTATIKAKDAGGNQSPFSAGHPFMSGSCDVPVVAITTPTPDQEFATGSFSAAFTVIGNGTVTDRTCQIDSQTPVACTNNWPYTGLAQGPHTLTVSATTEWGTGTTTVPFRVKDTINPTPPTNIVASSVTRTGMHLAWTAATDNVGVLDYTVTNSEGTFLGYTTTNSIDLTGLTCGTSFFVRVFVNDTQPGTHNWSVSNDVPVATLPCLAPPTVVINSPANSATPLATNSFVLATTITGNPAPTLTCSLDNAVAVTCANGQLFSNLAYGSHTLTVTAVNDQGATAQTVSFVAPDAVAPSKPTDLAHSATTKTGSTVTWTASTDNVGVTGYDVYVDGVLKTTTGSASTALTGLTCGTDYLVTVQAKDARGNLSIFSDSHALTTADCDAPTIPTGTANVVGRSATISFTLAGATPDSLTCSLDGGTASACTSPRSYSLLSAGPHSVLITATSTRWGPPGTRTVNFTVADALPSAPFNVAQTGVSQTGFTVGWQAATDDFGINGYDVWIDGAKVGSTNATTRTWTVTGFTCGTDHTIVIRAVDSAGQETASEEGFFATTSCTPVDPGTGGNGGGGGGGGDTPPPPVVPSITSVPKSAKASARVKIGLNCPAGCSVAVTVKIGKKVSKVPTIKVASGGSYTYLKPSGKLLKAIKAGLKKKQKVVVSVTPSGPTGKGATRTYSLKK